MPDSLSDQGIGPYTAEMWGDGSWGVIDTRSHIPQRVGSAASRMDGERIARHLNRLRAENEALRAQLLAISEDRGILGAAVASDEEAR